MANEKQALVGVLKRAHDLKVDAIDLVFAFDALTLACELARDLTRDENWGTLEHDVGLARDLTRAALCLARDIAIALDKASEKEAAENTQPNRSNSND